MWNVFLCLYLYIRSKWRNEELEIFRVEVMGRYEVVLERREYKRILIEYCSRLLDILYGHYIILSCLTLIFMYMYDHNMVYGYV